MRRRIGAQASTPSAVTKGKQISVFTLRARCIIAPRTTTTLTTGSEGGRCGGGGRCIDTPRSQAALRPGCEKGVSDPAAAPKQKERSLFMVNESGILALGMKKNKRGRGAERGKGEARRRMSGGTGGLCSALLSRSRELLPRCIFQLERRRRFLPAATDAAQPVTDGKRMTAHEAQVGRSVSQSFSKAG